MEIYIVGNYGNSQYITWLKSIYPDCKIKEIKNEEDASKITNYPDLLVFTGGADVNPDLYSENKGKYTHINKERDVFERKVYDIVGSPNVAKLGICRGSQFLTTLSGGRLIQHVNGHMGAHKVIIKNKTFLMTSDHHQMLYPFDIKHNLLGWSKNYNSTTYLNGRNEEIDLPIDFLEPEIVYYPNTNSLCIQGHPEYSSCDSGTSHECKKLVKELIEKKL